MMRVGVVGLGVMGQHHARLFSRLDCCLAGVADANVQRAKETGEKYGIPWYVDYRDMIDKVDAVSIAVPTTSHHSIAMDFLQEGVHCLVEKPIACSIEEASDMIEAAEKSRVNLGVGHIEQFNPAVIKLKRLMNEGILGKPLIISTRREGPFPARITDVGAVIDTAIHDIGVVRSLMGKEPVSVFSRVNSLRHFKEDQAVVVLDFEGAIACIEVNWFSPEKIRTMIVTASRKIAYMDYIGQTLVVHDSNGGETVDVQKDEPLKIELEDFLTSIEKGTRPMVDGAEGRAVLKISLESSHNNFCSLYEMVK